MTHQLQQPPQLLAAGYRRLERDDRLFDILPKSETREKGVELWEKWTPSHVEIIRFHNKRSTHHSLPLPRVEQALLAYQRLHLTE